MYEPGYLSNSYYSYNNFKEFIERRVHCVLLPQSENQRHFGVRPLTKEAVNRWNSVLMWGYGIFVNIDRPSKNGVPQDNKTCHWLQDNAVL